MSGSDSGDGSSVRAWEKLSSEKLLETPYFTVRSDKLRLPDGEIKENYYVLERPDAAIIFPVTREGTVVLVRQYRPPLERMELGLPAGLVDTGEEPEAAARRELQEETGCAGGEWEALGAIASSPSLKDNWAYLYLARNVEKVSGQNLDEHERLDTVEVPLGEVRGLVHDGQIVSSSGVAAVMLALEALENSGDWRGE